MSDQTTREAAARAWFAEPIASDNVEALRDAACDKSGWFAGPGADYPTEVYALSAWLAWAKADAANAAPVAPDPLAGVVWETPSAVIGWCESAPPVSGRHWNDMNAADRLWILQTIRNGITDEAIVARARAQLAREAKAMADWTPPPFDAQVEDGTAHESAPVAVTLEALREGAKALGWRVVHESGYERPDVILTRMLQYKQMTEADWDEYQRRVLAVRAASTDDAERMAVVDAEIARLRALGVTPAVLS